MARGQIVTQSDIAGIQAGVQKALQQLDDKRKDDNARLRAEIQNNGPGALGEVINRLALDISGMRAEIGQLRSNTVRIHDEALAATGAIRGDLGPIAANLGEVRRLGEASTAAVSERFDLSHARLATTVVDGQAEVSEGIAGLRVALAALRSEVAAVPIAVQAETAAMRKETEALAKDLQQVKIDLMVEVQTHHHTFAQWRQGDFETMRRKVSEIEHWCLIAAEILTRPPRWRRIFRRRKPELEVEEQADG